MSLRDEHFKDKHLAKALQHAPDSDIAPSESARKAVLDYADKVLKTRLKTGRESRFVRLKKWFVSWKIPSWQLAGMGSLAASVLVVVMIWHENPDDPIQMATAPKAVQIEAEPKLAQTEIDKDDLAKSQAEQSSQAIAESVPIAASAEMAAPKPQDKAIENVPAKSKSAKPEAKVLPQTAALEPPSDKAVLARAPQAAAGQEPEKEDDRRAKEVEVTTEVTPPVPVAASPVPQSATASAGVSADAAREQTVARSTPMSKAAKKVDDAEQAQPEAKTDSPSAIAAKRTVQNSTLALALSKQGGQTLANKDIQVGKLRILYLSNAAGSNEAESGAVDEASGYRKEAVLTNGGASEEASLKSLVAEVEAYNQTMREWHLKH